MWEDDGQDSSEAHIIYGGPNSDYSLKESRQNFKKYLIKYRPSDDGFCFFRSEKIDFLKKQIIDLFDKNEGRESDIMTEEIIELSGLLEREVYLRSVKIQGN